jgi:hypothetical protein
MSDDYIAGMTDCAAGVPHKNKNPEYTRGYAAQYEIEQKATAVSHG